MQSWGWVIENRLTYPLGIPFHWSGNLKGKSCGTFCLQFLFSVSLWWKSPVNTGGKCFYIWMGPGPVIPFSGSNFSFFSFQLHPPPLPKTRKVPAVFKEFNKSQNQWQAQIQQAVHVPCSWHSAENVFSRDVSVGVGSWKTSMSTAFPGHITLDAPQFGSSQSYIWLPWPLLELYAILESSGHVAVTSDSCALKYWSGVTCFILPFWESADTVWTIVGYTCILQVEN